MHLCHQLNGGLALGIRNGGLTLTLEHVNSVSVSNTLPCCLNSEMQGL